MSLTILHADADAFFAAVEQRDDPQLRGKPVVVGSGVVMAASYEARAYGIRGGMGGGKARRLCPDLIAVNPNFEAYLAASKELFAAFRDASPVVEGLSLEEAFLDVRGLEHIGGSATDIAVRLRRDVRQRCGLVVTIGVARTKLLAKMASRAAKPDGLLVLPAYNETAFLHPLPVERLWGVGDATAGRLNARGIKTVADMALVDEDALAAILGRNAARRLHAIAHNREVSRVRTGRGRRSFGAQSALGSRRARSFEEIDARLAALVDKVTRRMRAKGRTGRTVTLRLRFADFTRATRSRTVPRPTATTPEILAVARDLLHIARPTIERDGCTLVGVTISGLDGEQGVQLQLPLEPGGPQLDAALDEVRERFGADAVKRAALIRKGI